MSRAEPPGLPSFTFVPFLGALPVHVNPVGSRFLGFRDLLTQTSEVGGEGRRRELYPIPAHGSCLSWSSGRLLRARGRVAVLCAHPKAKPSQERVGVVACSATRG